MDQAEPLEHQDLVEHQEHQDLVERQAKQVLLVHLELMDQVEPQE